MASTLVRSGMVVLPTSDQPLASAQSAEEIRRPSSAFASVRAVRPPAASEPTEVTLSRSKPEQTAPSTGAGFARVGRKEEVARCRHRRIPSGLRPKTKHNAGMALAFTASACFGYVAMIGQRSLLVSGSGQAALPNPSVEPTKCSKLHFAAHLERWAS